MRRWMSGMIVPICALIVGIGWAWSNHKGIRL